MQQPTSLAQMHTNATTQVPAPARCNWSEAIDCTKTPPFIPISCCWLQQGCISGLPR